MTAKVFVSQETNVDFRKAEQFGNLVFLTLSGRDDFNNLPGGANNRRLMAHLSFKLKDFDSERDYLVLTGSPYVNAAIMIIVGASKPRCVKFLRWDNRAFDYVPMEIPLN